ncbi:integrase [Bradyrhizobium sp. USDA 3311]|uniref:tyrosine-type recombinase/integrase n=1 Tax=Bradyrhizobium sp. CCBAU 21362 TaxID=1325082 RepID=UPI002305386A|nr:hypothetical protein [Bradyrhizobium sp. CCBAU 21362]MDA9538983.1 hypothetical protein [Bradyrhizobium sp. CCBAU 21362]
MRYTSVHSIGEFELCKASNSPNYYVATYVREKRQMVHRSLRTSDLENAIAQVKSLVARGIAGDPGDALVQKPIQTVTEVLELYKPHAAELKSAEFTNIAIERINRLIGGSILSTMVKSDFDDFRKAAEGEGLALSTVARTLTVLRSACKIAVGERRLAEESVPHIPYIMSKNDARSAPAKGRVMTAPEIAAAIDQLDYLHLLVANVFLLNTASRIGAILEAQANQIDGVCNIFHLNAKGRIQTDKYRPDLPITNTLMPWAISLPPGPLVAWRGAAVEEIDTGFGAACKRAGLPGGENTYSIRHSVARYMLQKGVDRAEIGQWLGHIKPPDSPETTLIYSPYAPDYLRAAKAAVEDFVREINSHCHKHDLLMPPWRK